MTRAPAGTGRWLAALDFFLATPKEVAIVGPREDPGDGRLLDAVFSRYLANGGCRRSGQNVEPALPLLEGAA